MKLGKKPRQSTTDGCHPFPSKVGSTASRPPLILKAATGFLTGMAGSVTGKALVFLLQVLICRLYGPSYYGLYITGLLTAHILQTISHLGVQKGGMRFLAVAREHNDISAMAQTFRLSIAVPFGFGILVGALCYCLAPFIALTLFGNPALEGVIRLFSYSIPLFAVLRTASDLTRAFQTAKYAVLAEDLLFPLLHIGIFVALHALGYGFYSVIYAFVIASMVCSFLIVTFGLKLVRGSTETFAVDASSSSVTSLAGLWKPLLTFSLPLLPMGILFTVNSSVDIIMLNAFTSSAEVGEYAAAARWVLLFALINVPMKLIFAPMIAGQYGIKEMVKIEMLYKTSSRWMFFLTLPLFTFLLVARDPLMMVFGTEFTTLGPDVLGVLLIGNLFASLVGISADMLIMSGNQYRELVCLTGGLIVNISLNLLLIPAYGVIGAAVATTVSGIATDTVRIVIVASRYRIHPFSMNYALPLTIASAIFLGDLALRWLLPIHPVGRSVLAVIAVAAVVTATIARGLAPDDRELFVMLKQKLGRSN